MAKKEKNAKDTTNENFDDDKISIVKILLGLAGLIVVILLVLVLLLKLDVGGLGSEIIGPKIKNIPYAKVILPPMPEPVNKELEKYDFDTTDQAVEVLKNTEDSLKEKEKEVEKLNEEMNQLMKENERLKVFEENQLQFEKDKEEFDSSVVSMTSDKEFISWYEKIDPKNAAKIYEESIKNVADEEELKKLVAMYQEMKAANAAPILEDMTRTRIQMVSAILSKLDPKQAGDILGAMTKKTASKLTSYMYPQEN